MPCLTGREHTDWGALDTIVPLQASPAPPHHWRRMTRDRIFESPAARGSDFVFDASVAAAFDDMVARSVPFYAEQQRMIAEIAATFWQPRSAIFDLGCSTATTLVALAAAVPAADRLVGYD